jgi:uncharacterized protein HemY
MELADRAELLDPQHLARQLEQSQRELAAREEELRRLQQEIPRLKRLVIALQAMIDETPVESVPDWSPKMSRTDAIRAVLMEALRPLTAQEVVDILQERGWHDNSGDPLHSTQAALSRLSQSYPNIHREEQGLYVYDPNRSKEGGEITG